jgi:hypothetical protein
MSLSMVIIVVCMIIAPSLLVTFAIISIGQSQQKTWPQINGKIVGRKMVGKPYHLQPGTGGQNYVLVREYEYEVEGNKYVQKETSNPEPESYAKHLLETTAIGSQVEVYFNPQDPAESTLVPGIKRSTYYYLGFSICGIVILLVVQGLRMLS